MPQKKSSTPQKQARPWKPAHTVKHYFDVLQEAERASTRITKSAPEERIDIEREIARERKLKNDDAEQDIRLKRSMLNRLFMLLVAETVLIFVIAFMQSVHRPWNFAMQEWSFKLLIIATIAQITGMLFVAVRYLFPKSK